LLHVWYAMFCSTSVLLSVLPAFTLNSMYCRARCAFRLRSICKHGTWCLLLLKQLLQLLMA
jgi:hypothetical protein